MSRLGFNIFTGSLSVEKLVVLEADKESVFFYAEGIYVNPAMLKIIFGSNTISEITITKPALQISQHGQHFNFDDLMVRFLTTDSSRVPDNNTDPANYQLENLSIVDGTITYLNQDLSSEIKMVSIHTSCPVISSEVPLVKYDFNFLFDRGGSTSGSIILDQNSLTYKLDYKLDSLNLAIFYPYVRDYMSAGNFSGLFDSHQRVYGNFNSPGSVATVGDLGVQNFSLTDSLQNSLFAMNRLQVVIDSINVEKELYNFKYISLLKPSLKFELYEKGNNFARLFKEESTAAKGISSDTLSKSIAYGNVFGLMATYVQELSQQYAIGNYKADSVVLRQGTLVFDDYTLHKKFNYRLEDLFIKAGQFSSSDRAIEVAASSILNTSGKMKGQISVDPKGFRNMEITYSITGLKVSDFNPYSNYYVAHPFLNGICYYTSKTSIKNNYLKSSHKLDIRTIELGKKEKNSTAYNIPLRLAVALLRDKHGDIRMELPIEGDLSDPKYKFGKILWQVFKNLISKAVASPGKLLASKSGVDEKLLSGIEWQPLQTELTLAQMNSLDAFAKSLESTPDINLELVEVFNDPKEMDELALKEGKRKFLFFHRKISSEETPTQAEEQVVDAVHPKDSLFNSYLNKQLNTDDQLVSVIDKSKKLVGDEKLRNKLQAIYKKRSQAALQYMREIKKMPASRFRVVGPKEAVKVPYEAPSVMTPNYFVDDGM